MILFKSLWQSNKNKQDNKSEIHTQTDSFKYKTELELRFADLDAMGHVNNAVYFTYLEIARTKYWKHAINWNWQKTGVIIAKASMEYLSPILLTDKIAVYVRTSRIGNASFDLEYILMKTSGKEEIVCARGKTVCVAYDYIKKQSVPIPETEKQKMIDFERLG